TGGEGGLALLVEGPEARVHDGGSGKPLSRPVRHDGDIKYAAFVPRSNEVLTIGGTEARRWDSRTGEGVKVLWKQDRPVQQVIAVPGPYETWLTVVSGPEVRKTF